jgi:hypothetical protein
MASELRRTSRAPLRQSSRSTVRFSDSRWRTLLNRSASPSSHRASDGPGRVTTRADWLGDCNVSVDRLARCRTFSEGRICIDPSEHCCGREVECASWQRGSQIDSGPRLRWTGFGRSFGWLTLTRPLPRWERRVRTRPATKHCSPATSARARPGSSDRWSQSRVARWWPTSTSSGHAHPHSFHPRPSRPRRPVLLVRHPPRPVGGRGVPNLSRSRGKLARLLDCRRTVTSVLDLTSAQLGGQDWFGS